MLDDQIAAAIVFPITLIGMTCNWTVATLIRRMPSLKNAFGRLTASQATGDAFHATLFGLFFAPMVMFDIGWLKRNSHHIGHALLICYDISTYSHLFISLNRLCAIFVPLRYDRIFNERNTAILITFSWALPIFSSFYFYQYEDCQFYYAEGYWQFLFTTTPVCMVITWYADFLKYIALVVGIVFIDLITLFKVHLTNKQMIHSSAHQFSAKRRANEINFLKQACLQAFVFMCELITYFILTPKFEDKWVKFFLSTVAWVTVHSTDGVITLAFNREFKQAVCGRFHKGKSSQLVARVSDRNSQTTIANRRQARPADENSTTQN